MKKKKKKEQLWGTISSDKDGRKKKNFRGWQNPTAFRNKVSSVETSRVPVGRLTVPGACLYMYAGLTGPFSIFVLTTLFESMGP
jgi:hypothetical protein